MSSILENFYGVLFTPKKTFSELKENQPLLQAFIVVIFVSILNPIVHFKISDPIISLIGFIFSVIGSAFWGVISWLFWATFIEMLASIFKQQSRIKEILTLTGFALIPWIFIAPLELIKSAGVFGTFFGVILLLGIWLWVTVLQVFALMNSYEISFGRALIIIAVPFFGGFISLNWFIGFFATLFDILKS